MTMITFKTCNFLPRFFMIMNIHIGETLLERLKPVWLNSCYTIWTVLSSVKWELDQMITWCPWLWHPKGLRFYVPWIFISRDLCSIRKTCLVGWWYIHLYKAEKSLTSWLTNNRTIFSLRAYWKLPLMFSPVYWQVWGLCNADIVNMKHVKESTLKLLSSFSLSSSCHFQLHYLVSWLTL